MNILIVHAHHEPQSFSSTLYRQAEKTLKALGHTVETSDLYQMGFDPVSDRRNFTSVHDPDYLKQQLEERHASEVNGFASDIEAEMQKLERCDALIFNFPLWWFGMPAILKGWCDRVLAMGRIYGGPKLYENGIGQSTKRGLAIVTTGGGQTAYDGWGLNPGMDRVLAPIQHGIFWFNGFLPLEPFIAWSPVRISQEERVAYLEQLDRKLQSLFDEQPLQLPKMEDFPNWGHDTQKRFMVVGSRKRPLDEKYLSLVAAELETIARWQKEGKVLNFTIAAPEDPNWRGFLTMRGRDRQEIDTLLSQLPLVDYLSFEITELTDLAGF
ncbi:MULTISPECIES: NAD(P)H-dependent oxidoreductase [unclassified Roseofilum]|uniref:NAD(P)H-dependent oxidoreductase n=1 Tax=unclassified Roseofilum TaxID=2620099 RepID=UPI001B2B86A8|nr:MULTISPECIES: NAD(P)H-dependent oxidoreductase [unclassified Roseofilum]MBP0009907.1 NAD(P)H-dependent oxidoreductase [Roseofilum sp. Belize Diploria]MBP0034756.1 NAD(P)H-dependent oxidoreductase [Roseofilum sp. Belize BBD 4]